MATGMIIILFCLSYMDFVLVYVYILFIFVFFYTTKLKKTEKTENSFKKQNLYRIPVFKRGF